MCLFDPVALGREHQNQSHRRGRRVLARAIGLLRKINESRVRFVRIVRKHAFEKRQPAGPSTCPTAVMSGKTNELFLLIVYQDVLETGRTNLTPSERHDRI